MEETATDVDDLRGETYTAPLSYNSGQVEFVLPVEIANYCDYRMGDTIAFWPVLSGTGVSIRVTPGDDALSNTRRIKRPEGQSCLIRLPKELAVERGLLAAARDGDDASVRIDVHAPGYLTLTPWPPSRPATWPDAGETLTEDPFEKRLVEQPTGENNSQLKLELQAEIHDPLNLSGGEKAATRLTARNGALCLAVDFRVDESEVENANVRTMFLRDHRPDLESDYTYATVTFSKLYAHALGYALPGETTPLTVTVEPDRLILQPAERALTPKAIDLSVFEATDTETSSD